MVSLNQVMNTVYPPRIDFATPLDFHREAPLNIMQAL